MERDARSEKFPIGSIMPDFELLNVDNSRLGSDWLKDGRAALVVFGCNHCPYVQGTEAMLIEIAKKYEKQGLRTVMINSNDAARYPEDSFAGMQKKAAALLLPYPYLHDESQSLARKFDASCTPECYLFDGSHHLVYQGAITDRPKESGTERKDLLSPAIEQVLTGKKPSPEFTHPIGCSIKWKE